MATNPSFNKRLKEKNRQDKQREKLAERQRRKNEKGVSGQPGDAGIDPDIAGIVPGPQPPSEEW